jgi:hypothetical protein
MQLKFHIQILMVVIFLLAVSFSGCGDKTDQQGEMKTDNIEAHDISPDTISAVNPPSDSETEPDGEQMITIPDVTGTWTGTFDGKSTTLEITEQSDSNFTGKISINYKQPLHQTVKGNFSPSTLKISMVDQLHSKFMGKYKGDLKEDFKSFSGSFTKNRDGSQYSFNLKIKE